MLRNVQISMAMNPKRKNTENANAKPPERYPNKLVRQADERTHEKGVITWLKKPIWIQHHAKHVRHVRWLAALLLTFIL